MDGGYDKLAGSRLRSCEAVDIKLPDGTVIRKLPVSVVSDIGVEYTRVSITVYGMPFYLDLTDSHVRVRRYKWGRSRER
jgi:hypothetical protein